MIPAQSWEPCDDTHWWRKRFSAKSMLGFIETAWPTVDEVNEALSGLYADTIHGVVCGSVASGGLSEAIGSTDPKSYHQRQKRRHRVQPVQSIPPLPYRQYLDQLITPTPSVYVPPPAAYVPRPVSPLDAIWERAMSRCECRTCAFCDGQQSLGSSVDGYRCGRYLSRFITLYEMGCVVQAPDGPILVCQHCQASRPH